MENHESSLVPLDNLAKFALTLLIVVLAVGAVVLNLFNICERKYEVGVLTAIGVKKVKVAAQFAIELLIVTMCGIALGVAGGPWRRCQCRTSCVSSQETQTASQEEQFGRGADMGGAPGSSSDSGGSGSTGTSGDSGSASPSRGR